MIITRELVISNRKRSVIVADLRSKDFRPFPKVAKAIVAGAVDEEEEEEDVEAEGGLDSDYDYLLGMALSSLTAEKVRRSRSADRNDEKLMFIVLRLTGRQVDRRARH